MIGFAGLSAGPKPGRAAALQAVAGYRDNLLSVRNVAGRLGVSTATVYGLVRRGQLAHVRVANAIRFAPADVEAIIGRNRRG